MNINEIEKLIYELSWENSSSVQKRARELLISDENIPLTIQGIIKVINEPKKGHWSDAVLVLKDIGYPRNVEAIPSLIKLMQDTNWPGVAEAIEIMKDLDKYVLIPHIENALLQAEIEKDYMWIAGIRKLLREDLKIGKKEFKRPEIHKLLDLADW